MAKRRLINSLKASLRDGVLGLSVCEVSLTGQWARINNWTVLLMGHPHSRLGLSQDVLDHNTERKTRHCYSRDCRGLVKMLGRYLFQCHALLTRGFKAMQITIEPLSVSL